jgi:branched-chain amino acid transport system ATP-binding protein
MVLAVEGLAKSYGGVRALSGVSFAVAAGEVMALIGPNGAGKSTCFDILGGQLRPDAGAVRLDGRDIAGQPAARIAHLGVARTFQVAAAFSSMTVRENVQMALLARHRQVWRFLRPAASHHRAAAEALLAETGLSDHSGRAAGVLAYGELKRVELATALAAAPRVLLLDEPTAGMAPAERTAMMALIRRLATARGLAVLFTEHDMEAVFATADRVLVLHQGELIAAGTPEAVRADARVRAVYLGEA